MTRVPCSDPRLHEHVQTYCHQPALKAEFFGSSRSNPPVTYHLLLFELKGRVYGQILTELKQLMFPSHPVGRPEHREGIIDVEFESRDSHDPLTVLSESVNALHAILSERDEDGMVLNSIDILDANYLESARELINEFATPLTEFKGMVGEIDVISESLGERGDRGTTDSLLP